VTDGRRQIDLALKTRMDAVVGLTALLQNGTNSIFNSSEYSDLSSAALFPSPFVVFGRVTPNAWAYTFTSRDTNVLYSVMAVTDEIGVEEASLIDNQIDIALQDQDGAGIPRDLGNGWTLISIRREQDIDVPPTEVGDRTIRQVGGIYRILAEEDI
jgi:hypothetical protein